MGIGKTKRPRIVIAIVVLMVFVGLVVSSFTAVNMPISYAGNYNRSAAVQYADAWAHNHNSNYNNYPNDCTNFVSQVMENGALPQITGGDANSIYQWWAFKDFFGSHNSKTWSAADWLNSHFSQYQGTRFQTVGAPSSLSAGDIYLMSLPGNNGIPSHARAIVGMGTAQEWINYPPNTYGLLADSHSTDRYRVIWDDNVPNGTPAWFWHIIY